MAVPLIIVDSEAKAAVLQAQLGEEVEVLPLAAAPAKASWQIPKDKLKRARPRFDFAPLPAAKPLLDRLHAAPGREVYLALENNIQGEYWSWLLSGHLAESSRGRQVPGRLRLLGLNRDEFRQSFRLVDTIREEPAVHSHIRLLLNSYLGKHLDRLLGTRYAPGKLPLDFCTLAIIASIRERQAEVEAYSPPVKWQVRTVFTTSGGPLTARLNYAYGASEDGYFGQAAGAKTAIELFREQEILVREIRKEEGSLQPPLPYQWPELVQDAALLHGLSPLQVGRALEELAAGVQLDAARTALIGSGWSLAPVGCDFLVEKIRKFLNDEGRELGTPDEGEEPEAGSLLPLRPEIGPERLPAALAAGTRTVYGMIRNRALASQMASARIETGEVELVAGETCRFSAVLRRVLAPGFLEVHQGVHEKDLLEPSVLDHLHEGEAVALSQIVPGPTHGSPPESYTVPSLMVDLEEYGLAADPLVLTRLGRMVGNGYIELVAEGGLRPGEKADKTAAVLDRALPSLSGLQLPALIEQLTQEMATGRKPLDFGLRQFEQTLVMQGNVLVRSDAAIARPHRRSSRSIIKADVPGEPPEKKTGEEPAPGGERQQAPPPASPAGGESAAELQPGSELEPDSQAESGPGPQPEEAEPREAAAVPPEQEPSPLVEEAPAPGGEPEGEEASFGTETADAEALAQLAAEVPPEALEAFLPENDDAAADRPCPTCGRPLLMKEDRAGGYLACSGFPACRFTEGRREEEPVMACPLCRRGSIMVERTASGRILYVCREEGCEFLSWSRPHAGKCPSCHGLYLVEKKKADGRVVLGCPQPGCGYRQGQEGSKEQGAPAAPRKVKVRVVKRAGAKSAVGKRKVVVVRRKK